MGGGENKHGRVREMEDSLQWDKEVILKFINGSL